MRRALLFFLLLAACQNRDTNDRLARVEKKLDQIQQPVAPAPAPALPTITFTNVQVRQDVADSLVSQGLAEFVGPKDDEKFGVIIADPKFGTILYSRASEPGMYNVVRRVKATLPLNDERRAALLAIFEEERANPPTP